MSVTTILDLQGMDEEPIGRRVAGGGGGCSGCSQCWCEGGGFSTLSLLLC